jgi:hypothetical protein
MFEKLDFHSVGFRAVILVLFGAAACGKWISDFDTDCQ